jgi:hypothetical protein
MDYKDFQVREVLLTTLTEIEFFPSLFGRIAYTKKDMSKLTDLYQTKYARTGLNVYSCRALL